MLYIGLVEASLVHIVDDPLSVQVYCIFFDWPDLLRPQANYKPYKKICNIKRAGSRRVLFPTYTIYHITNKLSTIYKLLFYKCQILHPFNSNNFFWKLRKKKPPKGAKNREEKFRKKKISTQFSEPSASFQARSVAQSARPYADAMGLKTIPYSTPHTPPMD